MTYGKETNETIQITVVIAGRPYPLKINRSDEALMHRLVNEINDRITTFQAQFAGKDKQDCLAMTLLTTTVEWHKTTQQPSPDEKLVKRLQSIGEMLDRM